MSRITPPGSTSSGAGGGLTADNLPWTIDVPLFHWISATGTWTRYYSASTWGYFIRNDSSLATDQVNLADVVLAAGTWEVRLGYNRASDSGIAHFLIDGTDVATVDLYGATSANDQVATSGSFTVAATGKKRLSVASSTKNASSSAYYLRMWSVRLRRTA